MTSQEQSTQNDRSSPLPRRFCGLKLEDTLKFMSSLLLPLTLGVFTVVITFQQQEAAQKQRAEDRELARLQREEDRNASISQRLQDQDESRRLREQAKELDDQRYKNGLFNAYIEETGKLLKEYNGSIISNEVASTLARVKTLNIFRQLDSTRNAQVIRFLHEAKQLTDTSDNHALDVSTAVLSDIDFRDIAVSKTQLYNISLMGIFLSNATFIGIKMEHTDFSHSQFGMSDFSNTRIYETSFEHGRFQNVNISFTQLEGIDLALAELDNVNFSSAHILNADFTRGSLLNTNFTSSLFKSVKFTSSQFQNVNFSSSQFYDVSFASARLENVDFSFATFNKVDFSYATFLNVNFSHASFAHADFNDVLIPNVIFFHANLFVDVRFINATIQNFDFSHMNFIDVQFINNTIQNVNFSHATFVVAKFVQATLQNVDFSSAELRSVDFSSAQFQSINFDSANLISAIFNNAKASLTNFQKTNCVAASFLLTDLTNANFGHSNAKRASFERANLRGVNFTQANLYDAKFLYTTVTNEQLNSALSIQDALLTKKIRASDQNLINKGEANCNISGENGWILRSGHVTVSKFDYYKQYCEFILQEGSIEATIYQRVNLSNKWDSTHWPYSQAVLRANMSRGVFVELKGINSSNQTLAWDSLNSRVTQGSIALQDDIEELEVLVKFTPYDNRSVGVSYRYHNMRLFIFYGTYYESFRVVSTLELLYSKERVVVQQKPSLRYDFFSPDFKKKQNFTETSLLLIIIIATFWQYNEGYSYIAF